MNIEADMRKMERRLRDDASALIGVAEALVIRNHTVEQCAQQNIDWLARIRHKLGVGASLCDVDEMCRVIDAMQSTLRDVRKALTNHGREPWISTHQGPTILARIDALPILSPNRPRGSANGDAE